MTLNGVMTLCVISPNSVASGAHYVKVVEDVVVKKFAFAISSPDEFLVRCGQSEYIFVNAPNDANVTEQIFEQLLRMTEFLCTNVSQGSVAICLREDGIFRY